MYYHRYPNEYLFRYPNFKSQLSKVPLFGSDAETSELYSNIQIKADNTNFVFRLESHDQDLLLHPRLSIPRKGRIPRKHGGKKRQGVYLFSSFFPDMYVIVLKGVRKILPDWKNFSGVRIFYEFYGIENSENVRSDVYCSSLVTTLSPLF